MRPIRFLFLIAFLALGLFINSEATTLNTDQNTIAIRGISNSGSEPLSEAVIDGLLLMREEEKMARDVYLVLYEHWQQRVFKNIARSEQRHTDAIKTLLDKYSLQDPMINDSIGVFKNKKLQSLYNQLIERGKKSLIEALQVGALIEEIDILDLQNELSRLNGNEDIAFVYQNLMRGSRNHLRAFVKNLKRQGITYKPIKLDQAEFDAIVNNNWETGKNKRY